MIFGKLDPSHTWSDLPQRLRLREQQSVDNLAERTSCHRYRSRQVGALWTEKSDLISVWSVCLKDLMGEKQSDWPAV